MVINVDKYVDETELGAIGGGFAVGTISKSPAVVLPVTGVTQPNAGTLPASEIDSNDHPDAVDTGLKFEFHVPDDYDSGNLELTLVYAMSTAVASPNNVVVVEVGAEIADTDTGAIDTATYALASSSLTVPDNLTTIVRSPAVLTIAEGDFQAGDKIIFIVKRLGTNGSDLHTGDMQIVDYIVAYSGQIAARNFTFDVQIFSDTDENPPPAGLVSLFPTLDFETAVDQEQSLQFNVPDNWDMSSDIHLQLNYAMSTSETNDILFETEGEVANVTTGTVGTISTLQYLLTTTADTNVHRTTIIRSISASLLTKGSTVLLKLARRGTDGADTHGGDFRLISATIFVGVGPSSAVSELTEMYLSNRVETVVSGTATVADEAPAYAGDFELYRLVTGTGAGSQVDIEWAGRLGAAQTSLEQVIIPVEGNAGAEYQLKIYAEGSGGTPVYDSTLTAAPLTRTVLTVLGASLSAQPTGEKRYFVVMEAHVDSSEEVRVGNPFVRQG